MASQNNSDSQTYSMFHVTWTTFKFNRNQLGTVSAYAIRLWLIALLSVHLVIIEYRNSMP